MHHQSCNRLGADIEMIGYTRAYMGCYSGYEQLAGWKTFNKEGTIVTRTDLVPVIVEVIKHATLPIIGFQYHPEEFNCAYAVEEITNLLNR